MEELTIAESWALLEQHVSSKAPEVWADVRPGATDAEIAETERVLGVTFPEDVRASMRIHDGQSREGPGIAPSGALLGLATIASEWRIWQELLDGGDFGANTADGDGAAKSMWWNPKWIPMTYNGAGDHEVLDLDPDASGREGQMVQMWHDDAPRRATAPSFRAWLSKLARDIASGAVVYSDDYGCFLPAEDA